MTKLALITGSNKGIGNEIAYQLGKKGFHIILSGRDESRINSALNRFQAEKISSEILMMDVSQEDSIGNAASIFSKSNRKLDVLINNAGIAKNDDDSILNNDFSILMETLNTNSFGPLRVIQSFLPYINLITDMGGSGASRSVEQGAETPVWLATNTPSDLTGKFFRDKKEIPW